MKAIISGLTARITRITRGICITVSKAASTYVHKSRWIKLLLAVALAMTVAGLGMSSSAFAGSPGSSGGIILAGGHHGHHGGHGKKGKKGHHKASGVSSVIAASSVSGTATYQLTLSGTVLPRATLTLVATNSGTVTAVDVTAGQLVQAGQPVATVTSPTLAAQLAAAQGILQNAQTTNSSNQQAAILTAQAGVAKAQAALDQAQVSLDNAEQAEQTAQVDASEKSSDSDSATSDQSGLGTAQQDVLLDQANLSAAQAAMRAAQYQLVQAESPASTTALIQAQSQVQLVQAEIAQETVRAPFAGVVVSVPAITGQQVGSGTTLATVETTALTLQAPLAQQDLALIHAGEQASALTPGAPTPLPVTVQAISPTSNPSSLTFTVTLTPGAQPSWLLSGESAVVNVITKKYSPAVLVPSEAIVNINGISQVFEIHSDHTVSLVNVTAGISDGTTTMVTGIPAGTKVVAVGQTYLANGGHVKISGSITVPSTVTGTAVAGLANLSGTLTVPAPTSKKGTKGGGGGAGGGGAGGFGGFGGKKG
ncbi:MAG: HlyD family efflux transporter periplasmic adaptor subunit [Actinobacteria bacterium]|nr:HlyD family efflux transporter periplasmic adaptor subunit [Actinomycetota bacterium]